MFSKEVLKKKNTKNLQYYCYCCYSYIPIKGPLRIYKKYFNFVTSVFILGIV